MNITQMGFSVLMAGAIAVPAVAEDVYYDTARVLSVTPQSERIHTPRHECRTEYLHDGYTSKGERDIAGAVIGGIAGGLIGSQIGKGNGRVAGAAVGAATGAIIGDRIDNSGADGHRVRPVERCTVVDDWQTVNRGYLVTYRYNGRDYTTTMPYDPGSSLRVRVAVTPAGDDRISYLEPAYRPGKGWKHGWDRHREHDYWED